MALSGDKERSFIGAEVPSIAGEPKVMCHISGSGAGALNSRASPGDSESDSAEEEPELSGVMDLE